MSTMTGDLTGQIPAVLAMLGIICVLGITGNLLVIIVYSLKQDRLTATLFILVLAVADFLACLTLIPATMFIEYLEWRVSSTFLCKSYYLFSNSFIPFSSLLISSIAFDRYFCLCHPFAKIMTLARAKRVIGVLVVVCLILGGTSTFGVRVIRTNGTTERNNNNSSSSNQSVPIHKTSQEAYECSEVIRVKATGLETVIFRIVQKSQIVSYILCIISVAVLYVLIYRSVSKMFRKRKKLKSGKTFKPVSTDLKSNAVKSTLCTCIGAKSSATDDSIETVQLRNHQNNPGNSIQFSAPADPSVVQTIRYSCNQDIQQCRTNLVSHTAMPTEGDEAAQMLDDNGQTVQCTVLSKTHNTNIPATKTNDNNVLDIELSGTPRVNSQISFPKNTVQTTKLLKQYKDSTTFHNLKTALMLFVVAIVYIVTFLPAMLMVSDKISLNLPIFYLYYVNNAINPIVYGFMNPAFRTDIRLLLSRKCCVT